MTSPAPISVYVPCFNGGKHIARCLKALLSQTYLPAEILVIDDGSTDTSVKTVSGFSGVRLVRHASNLGLSAARNTGLKAAKHWWVASVDADVEPARDWLGTLLDLKREFPEASGFGGRLVETQTATAPDRWRCTHIPQEWGPHRRINPPFLYGCNNLFRKEHLLEIGGYDERLRTNGEDVDLTKRLYRAGRTLVYDPAPTAFHYRVDNLESVLRMFWAHHRHPDAITRPPANRMELGRFILRHLTKRSLRMGLRDLFRGRFDILWITLLTAVDGPSREIRAYRNSWQGREGPSTCAS
jgi:GT2 family glycosyltransferase